MGSIATGTDVIVIGAGPGGYAAAARAAALGKDVTLVEAEELGGTCVNVGCIPSKALISAADLLHKAQEAAEIGISFKGAKVDMSKVQAWKQKVIKRLVSGVGGVMKAAQVNVVRGHAHFVDSKKVAVEGPDGSQLFEFKNCIIATGSYASSLPFLPVDDKVVLDNAGVLALTAVPEYLVVIGGGYIGLELGTAYRKLGAKVTVLEVLDQIMPGTDPDMLSVLLRRLRRLEIEVITGIKNLAKAEEGGKFALTFDVEGKKQTITPDKVLVAVGRRPSTKDLGLENTHVQLDERGYIKVDDQCRTTDSHIFAIGDVASRPPMLAHKAAHEALVAAETIAGMKSACDWVSVPAVMFTDPEIVYVGMTEAQAKAAGVEVKVAKFNFAASGRALTLNSTDGLCKVVADAKTGVLLGVQMCGPEVSELIGGATLGLEMGATVEDIAQTIFPHPTLSEALMEAANNAFRSGGAH